MDPGKLTPQDPGNLLLMAGVLVSVEQANRHRLHLFLSQASRHLYYLGFVHRAKGGPVGQHPLPDLEAKPALYDRRRLTPERVIEVRHPHPA